MLTIEDHWPTADNIEGEHFFSGRRAINTTVTGEMLDDSRDFLPRSTRRARRARISCTRARERATCAAFMEESRMECINANRLHRKSGVCDFPQRKAHKGCQRHQVPQEIRVGRMGRGAICPVFKFH